MKNIIVGKKDEKIELINKNFHQLNFVTTQVNVHYIF